MTKKKVLLSLTLFSILIIAVIVKSYYNSIFFLSWDSYSHTISESKIRQVFIDKYKVKDVIFDEDIPDSLVKHLTPYLKKLICWSEQEWTKRPFLVFFHPQRLTGDTILILKNYQELENDEFMYYDSRGGNSHNTVNGLAVAKIYNIHKQDDIYLYFSLRLSKVIGRIHLEKQ